MSLFDEFLLEYDAEYRIVEDLTTPCGHVVLIVKTPDEIFNSYFVPKSRAHFTMINNDFYHAHISFTDEWFEQFIVNCFKDSINEKRIERRK